MKKGKYKLEDKEKADVSLIIFWRADTFTRVWHVIDE
jgi:hypothetical protein